MHNGLRIVRGGYYGEPISLLLEMNGGVHEPQEERVFGEVLRYLPDNAVMLELGSYWAFYSMWFTKTVSRACCYLLEPVQRNLELGQLNFRANGFDGTFIRGYVGSETGMADDGVPVYSVDAIADRYQLDRIHMLHADVQGTEFQMLNGATTMIRESKVDFVFVSTHSNALHRQCLQYLLEHEFEIIAEADPANSYSVDGVIAAHRKGVAGPNCIAIAKKRVHDSQLIHHYDGAEQQDS